MSSKSFNFPKQLTPFIGRHDNVDQLKDLINNPACRLLTLVGEGGIGKTRLAIQVSLETSENFANGAYYVGLQSVQSSDMIVSAIANALRFSLAGTDEIDIQLRHFLSNKHMLLVLDNFEHLMDGAFLLSELLEAAPDLKLLVTSREVLNLQEEWVYVVDGMDVPSDEADPNFENYGAIQLFNERAMRVNVSFDLSLEKRDVKRICELVGGMPLGLELAASWLRIMRANEVAREIQHSLDFLASSLRNIPERHRSMQAIFDHSWKLLTDNEKAIFKRLAVFRGGFSHRAAEMVAQAPLPTLAVLMDKSLIRLDSDGRYYIHDLLRQFAEAKLNENPREAEQVNELHCTYYADYLRDIDADLAGPNQVEATYEIRRDSDNVLGAWKWAIRQHRVEFFWKTCGTLENHYQFQSRYREGRDLFASAYAMLDSLSPSRDRDIALAAVANSFAWFEVRLGASDHALILAQQANKHYQTHAVRPYSGQCTDPRLIFGVVAAVRGNYDDAERWYNEIVLELEPLDDTSSLPYAYFMLANAELSRGDVESAQRHAEQAFLLVERVNNRWLAAYCLNELGNAARAKGDLPTARKYYDQSFTYREEFGDAEGMGLALSNLGYTMVLQGDYRQSFNYYTRSHQLYADINDRGGLGMTLTGLGAATCGLGDGLAARQYFQQALRIAVDIEYMPLMSFVLLNIGEMKLVSADKSEGIELLALVENHPLSSYEHKQRAKLLLTNLGNAGDIEQIEAALARGQSVMLETVVNNLLTRLSFDTTPPNRDTSVRPKLIQPNELIDPLTPRELEILQLIADGLTNPEIAETSFITVGTVKAHINSIYSKLDVQNRVQAVTRAQELGLV